MQCLQDAGCESKTMACICRLYENRQIQDTIRALRRHRCSLMEELHKSQEKVDCLDYLIRCLEKEQKKML